MRYFSLVATIAGILLAAAPVASVSFGDLPPLEAQLQRVKELATSPATSLATVRELLRALESVPEEIDQAFCTLGEAAEPFLLQILENPKEEIRLRVYAIEVLSNSRTLAPDTVRRIRAIQVDPDAKGLSEGACIEHPRRAREQWRACAEGSKPTPARRLQFVLNGASIPPELHIELLADPQAPPEVEEAHLFGIASCRPYFPPAVFEAAVNHPHEKVRALVAANSINHPDLRERAIRIYGEGWETSEELPSLESFRWSNCMEGLHGNGCPGILWLGELGDLLVEGLQDPSARIRRNYLWLLLWNLDEVDANEFAELENALLVTLQRKDPWLRAGAAIGLGLMEATSSRTTRALTRTLNDTSWDVRSAAAQALGEVESSTLDSGAVRRLARAALTWPDDRYEDAAGALYEHQYEIPAIAPHLVATLARNLDQGVHWGIGHLAYPEYARQVLFDLARSEVAVVRARALGQLSHSDLKGPRACKLALDRFGDESPLVREQAISSHTRLCGDTDRARVRERLRDPSDIVRVSACSSLSRLDTVDEALIREVVELAPVEVSDEEYDYLPDVLWRLGRPLQDELTRVVDAGATLERKLWSMQLLASLHIGHDGINEALAIGNRQPLNRDAMAQAIRRWRNHPNSRVAEEANRMWLGEFLRHESTDRLRVQLRSEDEDDRKQAARALVQKGTSHCVEAVPELVGALEALKSRTPLEILQALGCAEGAALPGIEPLLALAAEESYPWRESADRVIGQLGHAAVPALLDAVAKSPATQGCVALRHLSKVSPLPSVRIEEMFNAAHRCKERAIESMEEVLLNFQPTPWPEILRAARSSSYWVRRPVEKAARRLSPGPEELHRCLDHRDPIVRAEAARRLGEMGVFAAPSLSSLEGMRNDPDPMVRESIGAALASIRSALE